MYDECTKACMHEKLKTNTNPSSGLDGTTQTGYWLSKHAHICSCKHTLAYVWRVHEGMHVRKIENKHKSITRARWNNTNWLLTQQTCTHALVQAHACSCMTSARRYACMTNWKTTNPSSGLDRTTNVIHSAKRHTCALASTRSLTYDQCTKACKYEKLKTHSNSSSVLDWTTETCYW